MLHIRGFTNDVDVNKPLCDMNTRYLWHMVVLINDLGIARLEGLDMGISHSDRRALFEALRQHGVRRIEWRHHGIEKHWQLVK
jgi:hypothetical protein